MDAIQALNELISSEGGAVDMPGLTVEEVAPNFVEVKYGAQLKESPEMREQWEDYYTKGEGREGLELEIADIKANVGAANMQLEAVKEAAASAVASSGIPSVITVGSASSTANPVYEIIEARTKKKQLEATLKTSSVFLINALKAMASIAYPVPTAVATLISTLATCKDAVNKIPS